jgi:YHS domain-containing protein
LSFLIRVIIFLAILLIVRALLSPLIRKAARRPPRPDTGSNGPKLTVKDPICGMYMDPRLALRSGDQYFCSEECRRRYANPPSN